MIFRFGGGEVGDDIRWELDEERVELRRGGLRVPTQPKVLALLLHLARNRDRVVDKQELLDVLWPGEAVGDSSLTRAVRGARRAVEDTGERQAVIENARGVGYRFVSSVEECETGEADADAPVVDRPGGHGRFFVGRQPTLERLDQQLARAFEGEPQLALIMGPAGIGKTRVAEVFAEHARQRLAECLVGPCVEADSAPPFWPWSQILRSFAQGRSPASLREMLGRGASEIAQALPALHDFLPDLPAPPTIEGAQTRFRLHQSFAAFLRRACAARPLVLILDDLQRADPASIDLLRYVLRDLRDCGLFVVGTVREMGSGDERRDRILSEWIRQRPESLIELGGLDEAEIAHFVEESTGTAPAQTLVTSLTDRTGGNPLFLGELLAISGHDEDLPAARGLLEAIRRHLEDLSEEAQTMLRAAALLGREFSLATISEALALPMQTALALLDEALEARVVEPLDEGLSELRFVHGLIPEVLAAELRPSERVRLHGALGEALLTMYGADDGERQAEIAHHLVAGAPAGKRERAVTACKAASHHAGRVAAFAEAASHLDRALGVLELGPSDAVTRARLLIRAGERWTEAGDLRAGRDRFRRGVILARASGDVELFVRAALGTQMADETGQVDEERVEVLDEARHLLEPEQSADHVRVLGALAEASYFAEPAERAFELSAAAVEMGRQVDDADALLAALRARHVVLRNPDGLEERGDVAREWVEVSRSLTDRQHLAHALAGRFQDSLERGDRRAVEQDIAMHAALSRDLRQPYFLWHAELHGALLTLLSGKVSEAEAHATKALQIGQATQIELANEWFGVQLFQIRREQGRLEELRPAMEQLTRTYPVIASWPACLALMDAEVGATEEAADRLRALMADDLRAVRDDVNRLITLAVLAEVACLIAHDEAAARLRRALAPYAGRFVAIGLSASGYAPCDRFLAMCDEVAGASGDAVAGYERALALDEAMLARRDHVRCRVDLARVLAARDDPGDMDRALALLREIQTDAATLEMSAVADAARATEQRLRGAIPLQAHRPS